MRTAALLLCLLLAGCATVKTCPPCEPRVEYIHDKVPTPAKAEPVKVKASQVRLTPEFVRDAVARRDWMAILEAARADLLEYQRFVAEVVATGVVTVVP